MKKSTLIFWICVAVIFLIWFSVITAKRTDEKIKERTEYPKSSQMSFREVTKKLEEAEKNMEEVIDNIGVMTKKEFIEKYESLELEHKKLSEELIRIHFSDNPEIAEEEIQRFREEFKETFIKSLEKEFGEEWFEYLQKTKKDN